MHLACSALCVAYEIPSASILAVFIFVAVSNLLSFCRRNSRINYKLGINFTVIVSRGSKRGDFNVLVKLEQSAIDY